MLTYINTPTKPAEEHRLSPDEAVLLDQVVDIDGEDAVIVSREPVRNGSGRVVGERLTVTDDAWNFVLESLDGFVLEALED